MSRTVSIIGLPVATMRPDGRTNYKGTITGATGRTLHVKVGEVTKFGQGRHQGKVIDVQPERVRFPRLLPA